MIKTFPEQLLLNKLIDQQHPMLSVRTLDHIPYKQTNWPLYGITIGSKEPDRLTLCLVGGVHGVEKIGTHIVLSFLNKIMQELNWNTLWEELLKKNTDSCGSFG